MKKAIIFFSLLLVSGRSFAFSPECAPIKENNPQLGLYYDFLYQAKESAEVVLENIDNQEQTEFLGYHFGNIVTSSNFIEMARFRLRSTPLKVLPEDEALFSTVNIADKLNTWVDGIYCYRGVTCKKQEREREVMLKRLSKFVQNASSILSSKTMKCYLRD